MSAVPVAFREYGEDDLSQDEVVRRYRTLIEQLPLVVYVDALDAVSSNIFTSQQIEPILGYSVDEWAADSDLFTRSSIRRIASGCSPPTPGRTRHTSRSASSTG